LYSLEDIRKLAEQLGGAGALARELGVRENTAYRILRGDNKPSYNTLIEIERLSEELTNA
tara:strand:- start:1980 stop:2159 length:180 start_codon:yes stop_codon:yes gene_type:complete